MSPFGLSCETEAHLAVLRERAQSLRKLSVLSRVSPSATLNAPNNSTEADLLTVKL